MLTSRQIDFLNHTCYGNWLEINNTVDVTSTISLENLNLTQIPVQFGHVEGSFLCSNNQLTTLHGCPAIVNGNFECDSNQLTTLEGGPKEVEQNYSCSNNQLINLIGAVIRCNSNFWCDSNQLTSLKGCPSFIKRNLYCYDNPLLHILYGIGRVNADVIYDNRNEINKWIISNSNSTSISISKQIKNILEYKFLLNAPKEIRQHFSKYFLQIADMNIC